MLNGRQSPLPLAMDSGRLHNSLGIQEAACIAPKIFLGLHSKKANETVL